MRFPIKPLVAAAVVALAPATAFAGAASTAALSNLQFRLIDLDPEDGILASITFSTLDGTTVSSVRAEVASEVLDFQGFLGDGVFTPLTANAAASGVSASAAVTGTAKPVGTTVSAAGVASYAPMGTAQVTYSATAVIPASLLDGTFTVSANTVVQITGTVDLWASATTDGSAGGGSEYAQAYASLLLSGPGSNGSGNQSSGDSDNVTAATSLGTSQEASLLGKKMSASFVNLTGGDLSGSMQIVAFVYGQSSLPAVPEPADVALIGLGLLGLGWRLRRSDVRR